MVRQSASAPSKSRVPPRRPRADPTVSPWRLHGSLRWEGSLEGKDRSCDSPPSCWAPCPCGGPAGAGTVEPGWDFSGGAFRYSKIASTFLGSRARYWWARHHKVARWSPVKRYRPELVTTFNISRQKSLSGEPGGNGQTARALSNRLSSTVIGASRKISSRDIFASLPPVNSGSSPRLTNEVVPIGRTGRQRI